MTLTTRRDILRRHHTDSVLTAPFFLQETTEVNVVYKKDDGGVGHISPLVQV